MFYIIWKIQNIPNIPATRCLIVIGFELNYGILNKQVAYIGKSNQTLSTCNSIFIDHVTNY